MQSCWNFIINETRANYYDCTINCADGVLLTNKCFAWIYGSGFISNSGIIMNPSPNTPSLNTIK